MQSTAETVRQLQQQHASQLADLQRQLQLLTAMAQPDPQPRPWQLNLRAEASKYFLTELEIESDPADPAESAAQGLGGQPPAAAGFSAGRPKPKLFAAGLGLGPEVPRFLRWDQPVEVHDVSLQVLEQQVRLELLGRPLERVPPTPKRALVRLLSRQAMPLLM